MDEIGVALGAVVAGLVGRPLEAQLYDAPSANPLGAGGRRHVTAAAT